MFNWCKEEKKNFPELKAGDRVYLKEEPYWKTKGDNPNISYPIGHLRNFNCIFLDQKKSYKIHYIDSKGDYFLEIDSLIIQMLDENRNFIKSIVKKKKNKINKYRYSDKP